MGQGRLGVFPGLAQMFGDDRRLDFFGKGLFKGGFTAEDHDGVDTGVFGQLLVGAEAVAHHDHLFLAVLLQKGLEHGRKGLAEDMLGFAARGHLVQGEETAHVRQGAFGGRADLVGMRGEEQHFGVIFQKDGGTAELFVIEFRIIGKDNGLSAFFLLPERLLPAA